MSSSTVGSMGYWGPSTVGASVDGRPCSRGCPGVSVSTVTPDGHHTTNPSDHRRVRCGGEITNSQGKLRFKGQRLHRNL